MNFFERQAAARRNSARLVLLFGLAVLAIVLAMDAITWFALGWFRGEPISAGLLWVVSIGVLLVIGLATAFRVVTLRSGGGDAVVASMGGALVSEDTTDPSLRRLRNVVEEMAIASGVPMPRLYVLEQEAGINAFAAGYAPADAVVAVTRGALDRLNRDELQGVIAHEFSHILNGDMRLNIRLIGLLFGITMIALIGRKVLEHGRFGSRREGGLAILGVAVLAMVVGYLGLLFARMIKAGVSRSRETLADASAVQFTRQTTGLAGALKKIAGVPEGARFAHAGDAEEVSHMLFGDGMGLSALFATHPPLLKRIQALEPGFDAHALEVLQSQWRHHLPNGMEEDRLLGLAPASVPPPLPAHLVRVDPKTVAAQVAQPGEDDYQRADAILGAMPEALLDLSHQRAEAVPLLLGLLLSGDEDLAQRQHGLIAAAHGRELADRAAQLHAQLLDELHPALRLPLATLAFPLLRQFPRPDVQRFVTTVQALVHADGRVSAFEYCLAKLLQVQVVESLDPGRHARFGRRSLQSVRSEAAVLLAVVARAGHDDGERARQAYLAAMERVLPREGIAYAPPSSIQGLDAVWLPLDALDPLAKEVLVEGITTAIGFDGRTTVSEAELLRTICGVLHCPLPPRLSA